MQYVLGNMLNGGGGLNADGLSLDLQFALDKTMTARKGPNPVFTRASSGTFVGSDGLIQTAATNIPRFDHNPTSPFACRGLLIEESRTNLVFPSDTLATQTRTVTATAHTLSFYGTGTVVLSGTHSATVVGTGAYPTRTTLTFTPTAGSLTLTVTGSVTQAQLEAGSFATSYIPTTTASVVRSADVCSITGANFNSFYNQSEGTLYCSFQRNTLTELLRALSVSTGASSNATQWYNSGGNEFIQNFSPTGNYSLTLSTTSLNNTKIAQAIKSGTHAASMNGGSPVVNTGVGLIVPDRLIVGANQTGASGFLNGTITAIRYYKKRLSNAKLAQLTA